MQRLRETAIAEYHELLAADQTLTPATFEKLRSGMRKKRLLYDDRPIGIALRPHLLEQRQFRALTLSAERVTSALEKIVDAVVRDPKLMGELGLIEAEHKMALVDCERRRATPRQCPATLKTTCAILFLWSRA